MEETKKSTDLILNTDNTASWTLNREGDTVYQTYIGTFTFKCFLNPVEVLAAGRLFRELLGNTPATASPHEQFLSYALSQLKYRIIKAPPFWKTDALLDGNIPDVNILTLVLNAAADAEIVYREQLKSKRDEALSRANEATKNLQEKLKPNKSE